MAPVELSASETPHPGDAVRDGVKSSEIVRLKMRDAQGESGCRRKGTVDADEHDGTCMFLTFFFHLLPVISRVENQIIITLFIPLMLVSCAVDRRTPAIAQTPVAIHATAEEVEIWRQRSKQGPYLDDWQRILSRAQDFRNKPSADLWPGNQTNQLWDPVRVKQGQQPPNAHPGRSRGDGLRDAAFVYLLSGDSTYRNAARQALLSQAKMAGTNFANTAKWSPTSTILDQNEFEIANWLRRLAYGYSYIRATLSPTDQRTLNAWFRTAATYWDTVLHNRIKSRFPRRYQDDYESLEARYDPGKVRGQTHLDGYTVYAFQDAWKNISAAHNALVAVVGVLLDDATLKAHAKRFVKEWLMFAVAPDGTVVDQYRWGTASNDAPQVGYAYAGTLLGSIVVVADHLARAGDTELYEYETSAGFYGWQGGPKSLRLAIQRYAQITLGERGLDNGVRVYASTSRALIRDKRIGPGVSSVTDTWLIPANIYYRDPVLKQSYTRRLPAKPASGGYDPWGGDWGTYPGIRFMFGQLEGVVWPYPQKREAQ